VARGELGEGDAIDKMNWHLGAMKWPWQTGMIGNKKDSWTSREMEWKNEMRAFIGTVYENISVIKTGMTVLFCIRKNLG
jgi:hypothetical protein